MAHPPLAVPVQISYFATSETVPEVVPPSEGGPDAAVVIDVRTPGEHDDLVDATTLALMRFRQGGFLRLPTDEPEEIQYFRSHRKERFYTV